MLKHPHLALLFLFALSLLRPERTAEATPTSSVFDQKMCTATGVATLGGTTVCDYPVTTDRAYRLVANVGLANLTASHLNAAAFITCEYIIENKNGVLSAPGALTGSNNPSNNTTTTFVAAHAQASDFPTAGSGPTCAWTISATNARVTITNNSNSLTADVTTVIQATQFGSQ